MPKRFNSVLALCKMNTSFVQAPDGSTQKERNLKLNPTVRLALTDLYTQSDPTSSQTDLSTTHLVSISRDHCLTYTSLLLVLHIICSILFLFLGPLSKDPQLLSILTSPFSPHPTYILLYTRRKKEYNFSSLLLFFVYTPKRQTLGEHSSWHTQN